MADWTLIATTLGAAGLTGWFAYRAATLNSKTTIANIEAENERLRQQIAAENERLREQRREDHLRNRQSTYHQFLTAEERFSENIGQGQDSYERYTALTHLGNGARLFGTDDVRSAIVKLMHVYATIAAEVADNPEDQAAWQASRVRHNAELRRHRGEVLAAMRADVGPDAT